MSSTKYTSNSNCKFNISYHVVWIPKYRKRILIDSVETRLKEIITEKCNSLNLQLVAIECMPDHVHLFVKSNPNITVAYIVKMLKGYSSYILRKEFSHLNKRKSLWAPGYFCETIGNITEGTVIRYINNQKNN